MDRLLRHAAGRQRRWLLMASVCSLLVVLVLARLSRNGETAPPPTVTGQLSIQSATAQPSTSQPTVSATERPVDAAVQAASEQAPATNRQTPISPTPPLSATDALARAQLLFRYGDYAAARTAASAALQGAGEDAPLQADLRLLLARIYLAEGFHQESLTMLDQLDLGISGNETWQGELRSQSLFLRAEALQGAGRFADAVLAYEEFLAEVPTAGEIVQPKLAAAWLTLGNRANAALAYRAAADAAGDTVSKVRLLEALAQTQSALGNYADAMAAYDEILAVAQNAGYRAQIQFRAGQTLASAGNESGAIARWQAATDEAPSNQYAYQALVELVSRNVDFDLYQRGYIDLEAEAWLPAINAFQSYLDSVAASDARAGLAMLGLGRAYIGVANYSAALTILNNAVAAYPNCDCLGELWLEIARTQVASGNSVEGRRIYRTFAREHPTSPQAGEALWRSGLLALNEGNELEGAVDFLALVDGFPQSERAPLALYLVGLGAYQNNFYDQAASLFRRMKQDYPENSVQAVGYWLGRALQAQGENAAARQEWQAVVAVAPDLYYGLLAAEALHRNGQNLARPFDVIHEVAGVASTVPGDDGSQTFAESWLRARLLEANGVTSSTDPVTATASITMETVLSELPPEVAQDADLRLGRILLGIDQRGEALALLDRVYYRYRADRRTLYALGLEFERLGAHRLSLSAMELLIQGSGAKLVEDTPIFLQQFVYPRHFRELVEREAQANQIDPLLFFSLVRQESLFEEGARSYAAAQGLAQIIPDTGAWVAERLAYPGYTNDLIYRPVVNLKFGAYYLNWARGYLDDDLVSALVGYNAGPGNASAWRELSGPDDAMFVEILTVNEPRIYIQKILSNYYHYTRLYGE